MRELLHEPYFWGFMTAFCGFLRYFSKVVYMYVCKAYYTRAKLEKDVELFKKSEAGKIVFAMKAIVERIEPLVNNHEATVTTLERAVKGMVVTEEKMGEMMKDLKIQYDNFQTRMNNVQAGGQLVMDEVKSIKTEILQMKNGNIFVRNKK